MKRKNFPGNTQTILYFASNHEIMERFITVLDIGKN